MKLILKIEYFTRWGEELRLRAGGKTLPMKYIDNGIWTAEVDRLKSGTKLEYRYELHCEGFCRRTEWEAHVIVLPSGKKVLEIQDNWHEVPENLPLASAPFRDGVFRVEGRRPWKAAGTAVPVFSLRSEQGFGIGEFNDLKLLADWAAATGQKIIQILPINDTTKMGTWRDCYPYNANSSFALHPQFIHLQDVGVSETEEFLRLREELNALPAVDYERVNNSKGRFLREAFRRVGQETVKSSGFKDFLERNRDWLLSYSAFRCLREEYGTADFMCWGEWAEYDEARLAGYIEKHRQDIDYHCFVQYHLHLQLSAARDYARSKGVIFKGDLPIGVSRSSADAWTCKRLFRLDSQAGAPPDAFAVDGQNWGFPTYDWEEMEKDGYAWWKARLGKMAEYFDAFRIDHILGFFRIWEIPASYRSGLMGHFSPALPYSTKELRDKGLNPLAGRSWRGKKGAESEVLFLEDPRRRGYWHPRIDAQKTSVYQRLDGHQKEVFDGLYHDFFFNRHNSFWKESAMRKLPALLSATGMLACGEDLGMIPAGVSDVMAEYQILSLEIQRMPKSPYERFGNPALYPYYSVCTTSTHDMTPLRAWWEEDVEQTQAYWTGVLHRDGVAPESCPAEVCGEILRENLGAASMLTVLPLQDWLSIDEGLRFGNAAAERINVPSDSHHYWRYRMHLTLESLLRQQHFNAELRKIIESSGR